MATRCHPQTQWGHGCICHAWQAFGAFFASILVLLRQSTWGFLKRCYIYVLLWLSVGLLIEAVVVFFRVKGYIGLLWASKLFWVSVEFLHLGAPDKETWVCPHRQTDVELWNQPWCLELKNVSKFFSNLLWESKIIYEFVDHLSHIRYCNL